MGTRGQVKLQEHEARALCKQVGFAILLLVSVIAAGIGAIYGMPETYHATVFQVGLYAVLLTMLGFYILLGRLASGLGRSVVYWCGGTFLLQKILLIFAWIGAWVLIRKAVQDTYGK